MIIWSIDINLGFGRALDHTIIYGEYRWKNYNGLRPCSGKA